MNLIINIETLAFTNNAKIAQITITNFNDNFQVNKHLSYNLDLNSQLSRAVDPNVLKYWKYNKQFASNVFNKDLQLNSNKVKQKIINLFKSFAEGNDIKLYFQSYYITYNILTNFLDNDLSDYVKPSNLMECKSIYNYFNVLYPQYFYKYKPVNDDIKSGEDKNNHNLEMLKFCNTLSKGE